MVCGGGGMHAWGMVWELGSRCDTSHGRQRAVGAVSAVLISLNGSVCMCVQVAPQLVDVDGTAAMPMSGGGAVIGSTPRGAQVRAEGCCLAKGSV